MRLLYLPPVNESVVHSLSGFIQFSKCLLSADTGQEYSRQLEKIAKQTLFPGGTGWQTGIVWGDHENETRERDLRSS